MLTGQELFLPLLTDEARHFQRESKAGPELHSLQEMIWKLVGILPAAVPVPTSPGRAAVDPEASPEPWSCAHTQSKTLVPGHM